jgi:hypothetical protein
VQDLRLTENKFNPNPHWEVPLSSAKAPTYIVPDLFDQNGYDLCYIEQLYGVANHDTDLINNHRPHRTALRQKWMDQQYKKEGAVLNHALLFERKGYTGRALEQLKEWAVSQPAYYKLVNIKPKWGLDFSMDYYDSDGNTFEVLHWEYDGFELDEIADKKAKIEEHLVSIDWDDAAKEILKRKDEWYSLDFFAQSDYKCKYFGIGSERWKMVVWT